MSVLQRCPSYRESNEGVKKGRDQLLESVLQKCRPYRESNEGSKERQEPGVPCSSDKIIEASLIRESRLY